MGSVLLYIHVKNRQPKTDKPGLGFWLIVGLSLAVMFFLGRVDGFDQDESADECEE